MLGYSLLMSVYRSTGTGSYPPLLKGVHRSRRQAAIHPPRQAPYRSIASLAYWLQLGMYRQAGFPFRGLIALW